MKDMNMIGVLIGVGILALAGGIYLVLKNKKQIFDSENKEIELEKLTLDYVVGYFKNRNEVVADNTSIKGVILKLDDKKTSELGLQAENWQCFVLTYYNEAKQELVGESQVIKAKEIDLNLKDALQGKDMLVLN